MSYVAMGCEIDIHISNINLMQNMKTKLTAAYVRQLWKLSLIPTAAWQMGACGQEEGGVEWIENY